MGPKLRYPTVCRLPYNRVVFLMPQEDEEVSEKPLKAAKVDADADASVILKPRAARGITIGKVGPALSIEQQLPKPAVYCGVGVLEHVPTHFLIKKLLKVATVFMNFLHDYFGNR
jgi:hypothetical protein